MRHRCTVALLLPLLISLLTCALQSHNPTINNNRLTRAWVDVGGYRLYVSSVGKPVLGSHFVHTS